MPKDPTIKVLGFGVATKASAFCNIEDEGFAGVAVARLLIKVAGQSRRGPIATTASWASETHSPSRPMVVYLVHDQNEGCWVAERTMAFMVAGIPSTRFGSSAPAERADVRHLRIGIHGE